MLLNPTLRTLSSPGLGGWRGSRPWEKEPSETADDAVTCKSRSAQIRVGAVDRRRGGGGSRGLPVCVDDCIWPHVLNLRIGVNYQPEDAISTGTLDAPSCPVLWQLRFLLLAVDGIENPGQI